jgi:aminopeptidase
MYEFSAVAPERLQQAFKALEPLQQHLSKNVRLLECIYPTPALAQEAHMPTEHYEDFVYAACFPDWEKLEKLLQYFKNALDKTEVVEIETPDTKLHFSLEHSVGSTSIGKHCLPDGEVNWKMAKAHPNGHMLFDTLIHASGQICKNVRIEFVNGNIVQVTAEQGEASLLSALHEKQHTFIPTEFSIGGNSAILHPTESMLFEKKRFGTLAFALGSTQDVTDDAPLAVQWHMLKNISRQGELRAGGQSIFKDGVPLNF